MTTHTTSSTTSTLGPIGIGDVVTLVPRTAGAPTAAYQYPRARVVAIEGPLVTVDLDDGTRLTTSYRNIARHGSTPAAGPAPKVRTLGTPAARIDPAHGDELPLFDLDATDGATP